MKGRESVRDDERCGRSKGVKTPELIGQKRNFMDKDRCVSIETISAQFDVSVGTVHTIIREELKMQKICAKFVPRGAQRSERKTLSWQQGDGRADQFRSRSSWCSAMTQRPRDRVPSGSIQVLPDPRMPDRENPLTNFWWSLFFFDSTDMIYMHWVPTGQTVNKEYYVEVLREFRKRFCRKGPALFKSGQ